MSEQLTEYRKKRDFKQTEEPTGVKQRGGSRPAYVIQYHIATREHYDLRLEVGGVLVSFAVPKGPSYNPKDKRLAVRVENHPLEYQEFEGTIPKGQYGGGTVMVWDRGYWEPKGDPEKGLAEGSLKFTLYGERLKGEWALVRMKTEEKGENWLFIKERDAFSLDTAGTDEFSVSVKSGRTMEEIGSAKSGAKGGKNPFSQAEVQLAKLTDSVPTEKGWVFELKYDGYRILSYLEDGKASLLTRNGKDYREKFSEITAALLSLAKGRAMVLDGEVAALGADGRTDFQGLQSRLRRGKRNQVVYILFDILALDGVDLRGKGLLERKKILEQLLQDAPPELQYSAHTEGFDGESLNAVCQGSFEGVVGKRADSPYSGGRNGDWIKLKCRKGQEFVICGYTQSEKQTEGVSALLLGYYEEDTLCYAGRAGSGLSEQESRRIKTQLDAHRQDTPPVQDMSEKRQGERVVWVKPTLAAEIAFAEWTEEGRLRQASFQGLREDKALHEIVKEKKENVKGKRESGQKSEAQQRTETVWKGLQISGIEITNPDKLLYHSPDIKKGEIAEYYRAVSKRMLPFIKGRILSLVCCPKGTGDSCFFKKHPGEGHDRATVKITGREGEQEYFYVTEPSELIYEVQNNTLEFHVWGSKAESLETPDIMVFDLDPDEGMALERVRQGVRDLRGVLKELQMNAFLKTSGGKGYHVVLPIKQRMGWEEFRAFSKNVAEFMEQKWPDRYTANVRKEQRRNRIFIDWIRNTRGATSIAPYSVRARTGAPVSMPIAWEELDEIAPDGIGMTEAMNRLAGEDPWKDFFKK